MNVIEIIKKVINESLELKGLADTEIATIINLTPLKIKLSNNKILSKEFLEFIPKTSYLLNTNNELILNTKIIIQKKLGGQQYIIIDNLEDNTIDNTISTVATVSPLTIKLANGKILEKQEFMIFDKSLFFLRTTIEKNNIGKKLFTCRETGTGNYIFYGESE